MRWYCIILPKRSSKAGDSAFGINGQIQTFTIHIEEICYYHHFDVAQLNMNWCHPPMFYQRFQLMKPREDRLFSRKKAERVNKSVDFFFKEIFHDFSILSFKKKQETYHKVVWIFFMTLTYRPRAPWSPSVVELIFFSNPGTTWTSTKTKGLVFSDSYPPWNLHSTWKWMVGILVSFWDGLFSVAMLVLRSVRHIAWVFEQRTWRTLQTWLLLAAWWRLDSWEWNWSNENENHVGITFQTLLFGYLKSEHLTC